MNLIARLLNRKAALKRLEKAAKVEPVAKEGFIEELNLRDPQARVIRRKLRG